MAKIIDGQVHIETMHGEHPPDYKILEKYKLRSEMLRLSRETLFPLKEIFDNVCRTNIEVAADISYISMKSVMNRQRAKQRPSVPHSFEALSSELYKCAWIKEYYKGSVIADDGSMAVIFSSDALINSLKTATEIFVDGTFYVVPRDPHICIQLYTVHMRFKDKGIASVFILCEKRTYALYQVIWEKILEFVPELKSNVKFIMSDYEKAANKVLQKCFPEASIKGCWFHYNQAVVRKWRQLGLKHSPNKLLTMVMSVPLVPHTLFEECFTILQNVADTMYDDYPAVLQFIYVRHGCLLLTKSQCMIVLFVQII
ncbi:uncharacterized protein LOC105203516 [Solenopsis invicta]|uniref:uncharacterized protein LOC105203516 n=1 Tax=Solenopsis invicta TaxID=13686 RepID=UPI000E33F03D|nr:uncharacterized protein LOC105203516 [Solenopsis invicta]